MSKYWFKHLVTIAFVVFGIASSVQSQNNSLSEQLWNRIQDCYSMFEDFDEDGKLDYETLIDDSKNGYIEVSGSYPTCGCSCTDIVGAYKGLDGSYTFLEEELWTCSWIHSIKSNVDLCSVFPKDFGIKSFAPLASNVSTYAYFYLDIEIPQIGTDTKITIEPIPFGMYIRNNQPLCFATDESKCENSCVSLYEISHIAQQIQSERTLELLSQNNYGGVVNEDKVIIEKIISESNRNIKNIEDLMRYISDIKQIYNVYKTIEHKSLILGWDKAAKRFYIKSKGTPVESSRFKDFLINQKYWAVVC